jgi:hypothetical protein
MIKAAELQGVLGRNYSRLSLNPRYSFDLAVHEARLAQDYAIGLIRGAFCSGVLYRGRRGLLQSVPGVGVRDWPSGTLRWWPCQRQTQGRGGIIAHAKWATGMAQDYRTEGIETHTTVVENTQPSCK